MDGENNGKPYQKMDDLGGETPLFSETSIFSICSLKFLARFVFWRNKKRACNRSVNPQGIDWDFCIFTLEYSGCKWPTGKRPLKLSLSSEGTLNTSRVGYLFFKWPA